MVNTLWLQGFSGTYLSTPDSSANSITGDIDIRILARYPTTAPPPVFNHWGLMAKWPGTSNRSWVLIIDSNRHLTLSISTTGTNNPSFTATTTIPELTSETPVWLRATRVASSGLVTLLKSLDGSSWTTLGSQALTAGSLFDGNSRLEIGAYEDGFAAPLTAYVHKAELRNGIGGTVVAEFDATAVTKIGTRDPSIVVSPTGETWTFGGSGWDWTGIPGGWGVGIRMGAN